MKIYTEVAKSVNRRVLYPLSERAVFTPLIESQNIRQLDNKFLEHFSRIVIAVQDLNTFYVYD